MKTISIGVKLTDTTPRHKWNKYIKWLSTKTKVFLAGTSENEFYGINKEGKVIYGISEKFDLIFNCWEDFIHHLYVTIDVERTLKTEKGDYSEYQQFLDDTLRIAVLIDENHPLWKKYIEYINTGKTSSAFAGDVPKNYYGIDNTGKARGAKDDLKDFDKVYKCLDDAINDVKNFPGMFDDKLRECLLSSTNKQPSSPPSSPTFIYCEHADEGLSFKTGKIYSVDKRTNHIIFESGNVSSRKWYELDKYCTFIPLYNNENNPLIIEAKKKYPVGTYFIPAHIYRIDESECKVISSDKFRYDEENGSVFLSYGNYNKNGHSYSENIFYKNKWAKITSKVNTKDPNVFPAGTYVVLESTCDGTNCWRNTMEVGFVYRLREPSSTISFKIEKDLNGSTTNGWDYSGSNEYYFKLKLREATTDEIQAYVENNNSPIHINDVGISKQRHFPGILEETERKIVDRAKKVSAIELASYINTSLSHTEYSILKGNTPLDKAKYIRQTIELETPVFVDKLKEENTISWQQEIKRTMDVSNHNVTLISNKPVSLKIHKQKKFNVSKVYDVQTINNTLKTNK